MAWLDSSEHRNAHVEQMNINGYCKHLEAGGFKAMLGSQNTLWSSSERLSMQRHPVFALHAPSREEIAGVFRQSHAAMLSFVLESSDTHMVNSSLYVCKDQEYSLKKLGRGARYDTAQGLNELEIRFVDRAEVLGLGERAYCDTLARAGFSLASREPFDVRFHRCRTENCYLGAFKGPELAAFFLVTEVDDWVSMGGYSADKFLRLRPNNALVYYALHHYLVERKFRVVSYGLSSVQADSKAEGLHRFKVKMGFEAVPVHRAFIVNSLLRPFVNRVSWGLVNGFLKLAPNSPMLKKAEGALRMALQGQT